MPKADVVMNEPMASRDEVAAANDTPREVDYKVAFEVAVRQRDSANSNICNMQIELEMAAREIADLKKRLADK